MNILVSNYNTSPNFTGYKSKFSKELEKHLKNKKFTSADKKQLLDCFIHTYSKKVTKDKEIGSGFYGTVYKIDDNYVLKRGNERLEPEFTDIKLYKKGKYSDLKHYFGEAVAEITNRIGENMLILKNVYTKGKSIPAGLPHEYAKTHTPEECIKYYEEIYLPTFAKLPQKSFDGIAKDLARLNEKNTKGKTYTFDYINPNNFVLAGKTLRILDDINDCYGQNTANCISDLLEVFLNRMDIDNYAEFSEDALPLRKELAKKIILAGVKHNVPTYKNLNDYMIWAKTFYGILNMNIKNSKFDDMIEIIDTICKNNHSPKKRVELVKQYLEEVIGL